ncbi:tetratricopeptide repeat protein [Nostoc sp. CHAB 5836]|uniref:tetratricopeptide repeat protein n=1 Tax=Nostoc sp. CHAB 5836 TaxID=2780404 RepID=UPI001E352BD1|nr:tetratricopeptide repeat protein [Nostoc sp. CHAB 5836]
MQKHRSFQWNEAEFLYKQILEIQSKSVDEKDETKKEYQALVINNLGNVFEHQGKLKAALEAYEQALTLKPDYAEAHYNLGNFFLQKGKVDEAVERYQQVLKIKPDHVDVYHKLGHAFKLQWKLDIAVKYYQQAISLNPDYVDAHNNLGHTLYEQGNLDAAIESYQQALRLNPDCASAKFGIAIGQLPIIYSSFAEIISKRNSYQKALQDLAENYNKATPKVLKKALEGVGSVQPFYLAYQGLNDRDLQETYGITIAKIMASCYPQWSQRINIPELKAKEKIRIGFVSRFFYNHSNWKIPIQGWVENLDRSEFELFGYYTEAQSDRETVKAAKIFDKFSQGTLLLEQWVENIQQDRLHILIFPEFGMDPMTVNLGCLRLAPIQMTSWGHPDTSGLPTIDYYLSSDLMEPENAQEHYTEKLVRLPNLSIYYTPLAIQPQRLSKEEIGIKNDQIMFWCCQSLYKYLPQHDDVFVRIAQDLGNCKFVFIKYEKGNYVLKVFQQRLSRAFGEYGLNYQDYCIFLPRMDTNKFAGTTAIADVFLDSIGWSGCNSTLEAIAHNIPIVTLPGELMRGRHTLAILKMMGIEETIAATKDEYVKIAVRLGQDAGYRQHISQQVSENKYKLYDDLKPVRALEDFFLKVVNKPRRFTASEVAEILQNAVQYERANQLAEAKQLYHQILAKQPDHSEALYRLGILMQRQGQIQSAEELLSTASQYQPDSAKIWFSLGNLHLDQGRLSEAESAYKKAIALRPDSVTICNNLGYTLQQQGKLNEAIASYQKALEFQPNCTEAEVNLGNALFAQGNLSTEKQAYYAELNYKLGIARQQGADWKTAVLYYRQAIALQPDLVEAHYNLGVVLQQQGQIEEATPIALA